MTSIPRVLRGVLKKVPSPIPSRLVRDLAYDVIANSKKPGLTTQEIFTLVHHQPVIPEKATLKEVIALNGGTNPGLAAAFKAIRARKAFELKRKSQGQTDAAPSTSARKVPNKYMGHPISSLGFLKKRILPALERDLKIQKFHTSRILTPEEIKQRLSFMTKAARKAAEAAFAVDNKEHIWLWRKRLPVPKVEQVKETSHLDISGRLLGWEVGAGQDLSCMSKRKRRAREGMIEKVIERNRIAKEMYIRA